MKTFSKSGRSGFTLIELLVVIAIIAILAAILFPVFAKVREKARQTSCTSNLKQLSLGYIQYYQDYDEKFPCGSESGSWPGTGIGWAGQIYPYVKSTGVYTCPDDNTNPSAGKTVVSYAVNAQLGQRAGALAGANQPTSTVLFSEIEWNYNSFVFPENPNNSRLSAADYGDNLISAWGNNGSSNGCCTSNGAGWYVTGPIQGTTNHDPAKSSEAHPARHTGGANWAFVDGHVKWLMGTNVNGDNSGNPVPAGSTQCPVTACYYPYNS